VRNLTYHPSMLKVKEECLRITPEKEPSFSDNRTWKAHSRPLNIEALEELGLKINDFGKNQVLTKSLREYHRLVADYVTKNQLNVFVHTRSFI